MCINIFSCFILLFTCPLPCRKDQLAVLYAVYKFTRTIKLSPLLQVVIVPIQSTTVRSGTTQRFVAVDLLIFNILV